MINKPLCVIFQLPYRFTVIAQGTHEVRLRTISALARCLADLGDLHGAQRMFDDAERLADSVGDVTLAQRSEK